MSLDTVLFIILAFTIKANKVWHVWILTIGGTVVSVQHAGGGVGGGGVEGSQIYILAARTVTRSNASPVSLSFSLRLVPIPKIQIQSIIHKCCLSPWHTPSKRVKHSGGICSNFNNQMLEVVVFVWEEKSEISVTSF